MPSYWDNSGKYQEIHDKFWEALITSFGPSEYVEGEHLRAIARIYYDYCNNGFGNNLTGAFNWLTNHNLIEKSERDILSPYMNCRVAGRSLNQFTETDPIMITLEAITNRVIEKLMATPVLTPHNDDMFNYGVRDDYSDDEDEDDEDEDDWY